MTPQELKNSILQLAIQGKLVPQDASEGNGEELYKQIQAEKAKLIKEGKDKKGKPLPEITKDEMPFDIPDSWNWVRLDNIAIINGGFAFKSSKYTSTGVRIIRISDFNENGFINTNVVRYPFSEELTPFLLDIDNILLCMTGGTVGKSYFVQSLNEKMVVNQRVATIKVHHALPEYVNINILAPIIQAIIQHCKNSTNDNISMEAIKSFPIPLPPLAEQKRIVAKIEELLPLVDRYEQAWIKLEEFNKHFPMDMQKSILQMAIQGKLVPQDASEGTGEELYKQIQAEKAKLIKEGKIKKEKLLPEITEKETPFEIPESWRWCRLSDVIDVRDGTHDTPEYTMSGYPLITGKDFYTGKFDFSKTQYISKKDYEGIRQRSNVEIGDILFSMIGGNIGSMIKITEDNFFDMAIKNVALFKQYSYDNPLTDYLFIYLLSQVENMKSIAKGGAQSFVSLKMLRAYIFPLPPLAEQKRIVAKIKELMPLCEKFKKE